MYSYRSDFVMLNPLETRLLEINNVVQLIAVIINRQLNMIRKRRRDIIRYCGLFGWIVELDDVRMHQTLLYSKTLLWGEDEQSGMFHKTLVSSYSNPPLNHIECSSLSLADDHFQRFPGTLRHFLEHTCCIITADTGHIGSRRLSDCVHDTLDLIDC